MRVAFIADGRSENFRRWVRYFVEQGDPVQIITTTPCDPIGGAAIHALPSALRAPNALVKRSDATAQSPKLGRIGRTALVHGWDRYLFATWNSLKLLNIPLQVKHLRRYVEQIVPDVTVAFRTQNEGYLAAFGGGHPLILFTQGSDFVNRATHNLFDGQLTAATLARVDALIADCQRDIRLAQEFGWNQQKPTAIFPGNGGVDLSIYHAGRRAAERERLVVYPRGLAPYMRFDTLLKSIHILHQEQKYQDVRFVLLVTAAVVEVATAMIEKAGLRSDVVQVQPFLSQSALASLLQSAALVVSPSQSDGTPNSMLEAMACGAFPVMGDLESIREWVEHGKNGLLFDPLNANQLTDCMRQALDDVALRQQAQEYNYALIQKRAAYHVMMPLAREFILQVAATKGAKESFIDKMI